MPFVLDSIILSMFKATIMLNILRGTQKSLHKELVKGAITIPTAALHLYGKESKSACIHSQLDSSIIEL
jgi:phosphoribosylaminoimidazole carboxylase (NCAIR synthetase)